MANIKLNNNEYPIPDSALAALTADFVAHLGTISGSDMKVVVGGVEYGIDSSKVAGAVSALDTFLGELENGGEELPSIITWDGNLEGHDVIELSDIPIVKVSDAVYTKEQLVGAILTTAYRYDRADYYIAITEEDIYDTIDDPGFPGMIGSGSVFIIYNAENVIANFGLPDSLSNGVWFFTNDNAYTKQLTLPWAEDKPDIEPDTEK